MNISLPGGKKDLIKKAGSSIFISVAIASVVLAISVVSFKFLYNQMLYNSKVQAAKEEARDTLENNLSKAAALQASLESLDVSDNLIPNQEGKTNTAIVLDALPSKYDYPALVTSINKLANLSTVKLVAFDGDDLEADAIASLPAPEPLEITFSVTVEGSYKYVEKFITNLENSIRPMKVLNMRLSGSDESMTARFDMATYYQPSVDLSVQTRVVE